MSAAARLGENDRGLGDAHPKASDVTAEIGTDAGGLRGLTATWEDVQKARLAAEQRGLLPVAEQLHKTEAALGRQITRATRAHVMGDWLPKGLGGVHVARLLALIDDPWRFPGRRCTNGHYLSTADDRTATEWRLGGVNTEGTEGIPEIEIRCGAPCPVETWEGPCSGTLLPPRPGTGVRSLWHYCGLHVVDGRSPRKRKGHTVDWNPDARTIVLMPGGIAEQIVRLRVAKYRDVYDATKARLTETRAVVPCESEPPAGAPDGAGAEVGIATEMTVGLRPIQIDAIARKVAAKAFLGDLITEWKRRTAQEG